TNYPCQPVEFAAQSAGAALGLVEFLLHLAGAAIDLAHSFAETTQRVLSLPHLPQQGVQVRVYIVINRTERFSHVSCPASRSPSPASPCCQCTVFRLSTQRRTCPAGTCFAAPPAGRSWSGSTRLPRTYPDARWPWRQTWPRRTRAWVRPCSGARRLWAIPRPRHVGSGAWQGSRYRPAASRLADSACAHCSRPAVRPAAPDRQRSNSGRAALRETGGAPACVCGVAPEVRQNSR